MTPTGDYHLSRVMGYTGQVGGGGQGAHRQNTILTFLLLFFLLMERLQIHEK